MVWSIGNEVPLQMLQRVRKWSNKICDEDNYKDNDDDDDNDVD